MILKIEMQNSEWLIWLFHSQFLLRLSCCEMLWLYMGKADYKAFYGAFMAIYLKNYLFSLRIIYFMTYLTDLRVTVMKWFVTKQNKWVKPVEKHAEIPATTSGHLQLHALITCNSGHNFICTWRCLLPRAKLCSFCIPPSLEPCTTFQDFHLSLSENV